MLKIQIEFIKTIQILYKNNHKLKITLIFQSIVNKIKKSKKIKILFNKIL
jgi:hypothetical protein